MTINTNTAIQYLSGYVQMVKVAQVMRFDEGGARDIDDEMPSSVIVDEATLAECIEHVLIAAKAERMMGE